MSDTATSVQDRAREAYDWFETAHRGVEDDWFMRLKEGAPEWVSNLVYHAHGSDFLPDDWRYDKIHSALEFIADADDPDDGRGEFADGAVDTYTSDRFAWLSSHLGRAGYVDRALDDGLVNRETFDSIIDLVAGGQYIEAEEIYGRVLDYLRDDA